MYERTSHSLRLSTVITTCFLLVSLTAPAVVLAQTDPFQRACDSGAGGAGSSDQTTDSPACTTNTTTDPIAGRNGAIIAATSILAAIAGIVSVFYLVWGGFKYITSNGEGSNISSAKQTIFAALIGVVIAAMARPIVSFIVSRL